MNSHILPCRLGWTARVAVSASLLALTLSVSPALAAAPADGSVGNAGGKVPPGQSATDANRGRDCDDNPGAGDGNPAFAACAPVTGVDAGTDEGSAGSEPVDGGSSGDGAGSEDGDGPAGEAGDGDITSSEGEVVGNAGENVTTGGPDEDVVTGGTDEDVVIGGSGPEETGISWIVITRPVREVVTAPVLERTVVAPVEAPAAPPTIGLPVTAPGGERAGTAPVVRLPVAAAPAAKAPREQAASSGVSTAPAPSRAGFPASAVPASLPFTGSATGSAVLLGGGLALVGLMLLVAGRRTSR